MKVDINVKIIKKDFVYEFEIPSYKTEGSAGMDLFACLPREISVKPKEIISVPTGIAIEINDDNIGGFIFPRSGLSTKHGISLANAVGVIDSDYRGEIKCSLINHGEKDYEIKPADRIAQIIFMPIYRVNLILVDELQETKRGSGGFGSTGR